MKEKLGILREDISSKFDLVLEGHEVLRSEIRETRTELKKDMELCNFKIDTLKRSMPLPPISRLTAVIQKRIMGCIWSKRVENVLRNKSGSIFMLLRI